MQKIARTLHDLLLRLALMVALAVTMVVVGTAADAAAAPGHCPHQAAAMPDVPAHDHGTGHMSDAACLQACLGAAVMGEGPCLTPALQPRRQTQETPDDWVFRSALPAPLPRPPKPGVC